MVELLAFPNEIIADILSFCDSNSLCSVARTCSTLYGMTRHEFYRCIKVSGQKTAKIPKTRYVHHPDWKKSKRLTCVSLTTPEQFDKFLEKLQSNPHLLTLISSLDISFFPQYLCSDQKYFARNQEIEWLLANCSHLRELTVVDNNINKTPSGDNEQRVLLLPLVSSLSIIIAEYDSRVLFSTGFSLKCSRLTKFSLKVNFRVKFGIESLKETLYENRKSLTDITIDLHGGSGPYTKIVSRSDKIMRLNELIGTIKFDNLSHLSLSGFDIGNVDVDGFARQINAENLRSLKWTISSHNDYQFLNSLANTLCSIQFLEIQVSRNIDEHKTFVEVAKILETITDLRVFRLKLDSDHLKSCGHLSSACLKLAKIIAANHGQSMEYLSIAAFHDQILSDQRFWSWLEGLKECTSLKRLELPPVQTLDDCQWISSLHQLRLLECSLEQVADFFPLGDDYLASTRLLMKYQPQLKWVKNSEGNVYFVMGQEVVAGNDLEFAEAVQGSFDVLF